MESNKARYTKLSQMYEANPNQRLEVRKSHIHNWGLFTKSYFQKNEMIVEYVYGVQIIWYIYIYVYDRFKVV